MDEDADFLGKAQSGDADSRPVSDTARSNLGRTFAIDLELAGNAAMVTVYESGAPRFKQSMTYADVERLLDGMSES